MTEDKAYALLIDYELVSDETLNIITGIYGFYMNTLEDVLYYKTGYHDFHQFIEELV